MKFTINGNEHELRFGMKLARVLDEAYKIDYQGMEFGMGVNMALMNLQQKNPVAIGQVLKAGLSHLKTVPHQYQIDDAVEEYGIKNGDLGELFEELADEMGKSPTLKATINNFKTTAKVEENQEEE